MTSAADPHSTVTCPACGRGVPGDSRTCPSCNKSTLVDLRVLQPVTDHRKAYEAARRLPELHPSATFQQVKKALETKGAVVLAGVPPGPAVDVLTYLEEHGIAAYAAPPASMATAGGSRRPVALAGLAAVLVAAGGAFWLLRPDAGEDLATVPAAASAVATSAPPAATGAFDPEVAARSVVQLYCGGNRGRGFYVEPTVIVTLGRLCEPGPISVVRSDGETADATVDATPQGLNTGLVELTVPDTLAGTPLAKGNPAHLSTGAVVWAYGGKNVGETWARTRVAFRRLDLDGLSYVQLEDETLLIADGGPLVDAGGAVVGILGAAQDRRDLAAYLDKPPPKLRPVTGLVIDRPGAEADDFSALSGKMLLAYAALTPRDTLGIAIVELSEEVPKGTTFVSARLWRHGVSHCQPTGRIVAWESYSLDLLRERLEAATYDLLRERNPDLKIWIGFAILVMGPGCEASPFYLNAEITLDKAVSGYDRVVIQRGELPGG